MLFIRKCDNKNKLILQEVTLPVLCGPPCTWLRIRCFYEIFKLRLALLVNLKAGQLWF